MNNQISGDLKRNKSNSNIEIVKNDNYENREYFHKINNKSYEFQNNNYDNLENDNSKNYSNRLNNGFYNSNNTANYQESYQNSLNHNNHNNNGYHHNNAFNQYNKFDNNWNINAFHKNNFNSNINKYLSCLSSVVKITKIYLLFFIFSILSFIAGIVIFVTGAFYSDSSSSSESYGQFVITGAIFFVIAIAFCVINLVINIIFIVKLGIIRKFTIELDTIFIFAVIGLFISIFGLIALIMASSTSKKILNDYNYSKHSNNNIINF